VHICVYKCMLGARVFVYMHKRIILPHLKQITTYKIRFSCMSVFSYVHIQTHACIFVYIYLLMYKYTVINAYISVFYFRVCCLCAMCWIPSPCMWTLKVDIVFHNL